MTASKFACMESSIPGKVPILSAGELTPETLRTFEMYCKAYFVQKEVLATDQVEKIALGIQDPRIQNWYMANKARINAMSFKDYIVELRRTWLPTDWEANLRACILSARQEEISFHEWALEVQAANAILQGTASYLEEAGMRNQLKVGRHADLSIMCRIEHTDTIQDFQLWLEAVHFVDDKRRRDMAMQRQLINENLQKRCEQRTANVAAGDRKPLTNTTNAPTTRAPALTENERALLKKHDGFKCCQFYVTHKRLECVMNT